MDMSMGRRDIFQGVPNKQKLDHPPRTLGERVRAARDAKGLSQKKLAATVGIDQSTLSAIEIGNTLMPEAKTIIGLAAALGRSARYLQNGYEEAAPGAGLTGYDALKELFEAMTTQSRDVLLATAHALVAAQKPPEPDKPMTPPKPKPRRGRGNQDDGRGHSKKPHH